MIADPEKKTPRERETTDQSLRTERQKTDAELASTLGVIKEDSDEVVAEARHKADSVLSDARHLEDRKLAADGSSAEAARTLDHERAKEDAVLTAERGGADAAASDERTRREKALASLLAFERQDTDLRLEIERARADEAVTSREDFLAMVSHDLRSLLGGIALGADVLNQLAKSGEPIARVASIAERIQRFVARMNRLIGDLMDVAAIEAGKLSVVMAPCDANAVVGEAMEAFASAAAASQIRLTSRIGSDLAPIDFDHERILQVLINLVGNALKFTASGGHVSIRVESWKDAVCFAVEDDGEGIPGDRLDKVFDRFFQTRRNDRRGLGLGLYISRSIVEAHGGKIWAESTPGHGSTFFFTIPLRAAVHPPVSK